MADNKENEFEIEITEETTIASNDEENKGSDLGSVVQNDEEDSEQEDKDQKGQDQLDNSQEDDDQEDNDEEDDDQEDDDQEDDDQEDDDQEDDDQEDDAQEDDDQEDDSQDNDNQDQDDQEDSEQNDNQEDNSQEDNSQEDSQKQDNQEDNQNDNKQENKDNGQNEEGNKDNSHKDSSQDANNNVDKKPEGDRGHGRPGAGDGAKEAGKEGAKEAGKEAGKEAAKEGAKEAGKEVGKEAAKEVGKEVAKETGKAATSQAAGAAAGAASGPVGWVLLAIGIIAKIIKWIKAHPFESIAIFIVALLIGMLPIILPVVVIYAFIEGLLAFLASLLGFAKNVGFEMLENMSFGLYDAKTHKDLDNYMSLLDADESKITDDDQLKTRDMMFDMYDMTKNYFDELYVKGHSVNGIVLPTDLQNKSSESWINLSQKQKNEYLATTVYGLSEDILEKLYYGKLYVNSTTSATSLINGTQYYGIVEVDYEGDKLEKNKIKKSNDKYYYKEIKDSNLITNSKVLVQKLYEGKLYNYNDRTLADEIKNGKKYYYVGDNVEYTHEGSTVYLSNIISYYDMLKKCSVDYISKDNLKDYGSLDFDKKNKNFNELSEEDKDKEIKKFLETRLNTYVESENIFWAENGNLEVTGEEIVAAMFGPGKTHAVSEIFGKTALDNNKINEDSLIESTIYKSKLAFSSDDGSNWKFYPLGCDGYVDSRFYVSNELSDILGDWIVSGLQGLFPILKDVDDEIKQNIIYADDLFSFSFSFADGFKVNNDETVFYYAYKQDINEGGILYKDSYVYYINDENGDKIPKYLINGATFTEKQTIIDPDTNEYIETDIVVTSSYFSKEGYLYCKFDFDFKNSAVTDNTKKIFIQLMCLSLNMWAHDISSDTTSISFRYMENGNDVLVIDGVESSAVDGGLMQVNDIISGKLFSGNYEPEPVDGIGMSLRYFVSIKKEGKKFNIIDERELVKTYGIPGAFSYFVPLEESTRNIPFLIALAQEMKNTKIVLSPFNSTYGESKMQKQEWNYDITEKNNIPALSSDKVFDWKFENGQLLVKAFGINIVNIQPKNLRIYDITLTKTPMREVVYAELWDRTILNDFKEVTTQTGSLAAVGKGAYKKTIEYVLANQYITYNNKPIELIEKYNVSQADVGIYEEVTGRPFLSQYSYEQLMARNNLKSEWANSFGANEMLKPVTTGTPKSLDSTSYVLNIKGKYNAVSVTSENSEFREFIDAKGNKYYVYSDGTVKDKNGKVVKNSSLLGTRTVGVKYNGSAGEVVAVDKGEVIEIYNQPVNDALYSKYVIVYHEESKTFSMYAMLSSIDVSVRQKLEQGQRIGTYSGTMYFEYRQGGGDFKNFWSATPMSVVGKLLDKIETNNNEETPEGTFGSN